MHTTEPYKPNLIGQTAEIIDDINAFQIMNKLELAGRVCYKSENKIGWVDCPECHGKIHECQWKKWHKDEQIHSSFPFIKRLLHQLHHESAHLLPRRTMPLPPEPPRDLSLPRRSTGGDHVA